MTGTPMLDDLPSPPPGRDGWPWTQAQPPLPAAMAGGAAWPRISIVTPSFNQGLYLEETIRSVLLQGYPNLQYSIIDGGSSDDSVAVIKKYGKFLDYWVSEQDRGQSNAINKGLARCDGEIFNWINSDDLFCPQALKVVAERWLSAPGGIIAGTVVNFDESGRERAIVPAEITLENFIRWCDKVTNRRVWHQPGTFVPLAEVRRAGGVREDLRFSMDHYLMIQLLQRCQVQYVPRVLARFRVHSQSKTGGDRGRFRLEIIQTIMSMPAAPIAISRGELRQEHARALMGCAICDLKDRRIAPALAGLLHALVRSPGVTAGMVSGSLGRRLRRTGSGEGEASR